MLEDVGPIHGRGASDNPPNRFEKIHYERDHDAPEEEQPAPTTQFFKDHSRSLIAYNDSPDIPFTTSINPYRGCENGCVYCFARPTHEWLGLSAGLDFETKIFVKEDAPNLLRRELMSPRWQPQVVSISGVTDPYQPIERRLQLTRRCLEILLEFRNPVGIVTKSRLVTRDLDLLQQFATHDAALVFLSVTTLDGYLARLLEPRAAQPSGRLAAIRSIAEVGIPVGVMVAPVIPGLTDHELPAILEASAAAGARFAGYTPVRLPLGVASLFEQWLAQHFPDRKDKILDRIRSIRGGKLNESSFGKRMRGEGVIAEAIHDLFTLGCRKAGITGRGPHLSTAAFRRPGAQRLLFE
jgi:DNA repair photolyase